MKRSGLWADQLKTDAAELFDLVSVKVSGVFLGSRKGTSETQRSHGTSREHPWTGWFDDDNDGLVMGSWLMKSSFSC